jgi:SAM-dependent methyltransferase
MPGVTLHPAFDVDTGAPRLARRAAEAVLRAERVEPTDRDLRVHATDPVFGHLLSIGHSVEYAIGAYFHNALEARALLDRFVASLERPPSAVLDFASGFGRVARFVARRLPPGGLDTADVLSGAAAFNVATFGVGAFESNVDPDAVVFPRRYDLVYVFSLFTHLPMARARRWLARLREALVDDGVLIASTHGVAYGRRFGLVPTDASEVAFHYEPRSEIPTFDPDEYGVACFAPAAFEEALHEAGFATSACFERGLWNAQDVFVAGAAARPIVAPPPAPHGRFERLTLRRDGSVDGEAVVDLAPEAPPIVAFHPSLEGRDGPRLTPPSPESSRDIGGRPLLRYRVRYAATARPFEGPQIVGLVSEQKEGARRLVAGAISNPE